LQRPALAPGASTRYRPAALHVTSGGPMGTRLPTDLPQFYEAHVFVCCNRRPEEHRRGSCAAKGSERLRDYMKARVKELGIPGVRVNSAGCLDRCELGPCVVIYPEGVWYRVGSTADVDTVVQKHLVEGGRAEALMLPAGAP
jgi:(2Fe-2S) ferredoxin